MWMGLHLGVVATTRLPGAAERWAACKEVSGTLRIHSCLAVLWAYSPGCGRGASNRSRKSIVSSAPLGHSLSGGFLWRTEKKVSGTFVDRRSGVLVKSRHGTTFGYQRPVG